MDDILRKNFLEAVRFGDAKKVKDRMLGVGSYTLFALLKLNEEGFNPLHIAASRGHVDVVETLVAYIDPKEKSAWGQTAIDIARVERDAEQHKIEEKAEAAQDKDALGEIEDALLNGRNLGRQQLSQLYHNSKAEKECKPIEPTQRLLNLCSVVKILERFTISAAMPEGLTNSRIITCDVRMPERRSHEQQQLGF